MRRRDLTVLTLAALVAACSSSGASSPGASVARAGSGAQLTIYAASSLKAALDKARTQYETTHPGTALVISTDGSSALETKIEQGAPSDVFLSADTANPQKLVDKAMAGGALTNFARNKLTVIVPRDNPAKVQTAVDLARSGVRIIAAGDAVPVTKYTNQLVGNLAKQPGYPSDFVAAYEANVASKEDNVGAIVAKVGTGQGDAGIVYATDAHGKADVTSVDVPADANVVATYAGTVIKSSANPSAANAFLTWLAGPDGQAVLSGFGFLPPT